MNQLVAFRCVDGTYLLVPDAASTPWLENRGVEFLGEVDLRSFTTVVATRILRQIEKWNVARITPEDCWFAWSRPADAVGAVDVNPAASPASSRRLPRRRSLSQGS